VAFSGQTQLPEQRFEQLFDRHHREVYAYCRRRTDAETAADCAAETFLVAWRRIKDLPDGDAALWWLYAVARRVLANEYRRNRHRRSLLSQLRDTRPNPEPQPETVVVRREQDVAVVAALERLPERDRELLRLALWEEVPHAELAALLGCSTQAATQRIYRATRRAAKEFRHLEHRTRVSEASRQLGGGETQ
jgi:RNA polymerase sigma-70 factor (ECF subfamily)